MRLRFHIGGRGNVENVKMAVDTRRAVLAMTSAGVSAEDKELIIPEIVDLALRGDFRLLGFLGRGIGPQGQGDDVFALVFRVRGAGDVVFQ